MVAIRMRQLAPTNCQAMRVKHSKPRIAKHFEAYLIGCRHAGAVHVTAAIDTEIPLQERHHHECADVTITIT
jgi:hypothetical protein